MKAFGKCFEDLPVIMIYLLFTAGAIYQPFKNFTLWLYDSDEKYLLKDKIENNFGDSMRKPPGGAMQLLLPTSLNKNPIQYKPSQKRILIQDQGGSNTPTY